jgi:HAD superfamily hydrolase (TIGR01662 family)
MSQEIVMVMGFPASGKSLLSTTYMDRGYVHLNRDKVGGRTIGLLPELERALKNKANVVLDNTHITAEKRKPFIEAAQRAGVPIRCEWMTTKVEDCSINALHRMWERHGRLFLHPEDFKAVKGEPNMFPITVLFKFKKEFEKPIKEEGFASVKRVKFERRPSRYSGKAIIFDYDDTLRTTEGEFKFPVNPGEIRIMPGRKEKFKALRKKGYLLLGASNQSGVARKQVTDNMVKTCFHVTNELLGADIEYHYCPHNVPPVCYCRKPQSGLGVLLIEMHKLNPANCIYVGDQTTDKTFAKRLGFEYCDQSEFFH